MTELRESRAGMVPQHAGRAGAVARRSRLTIAGGVRGDNWSEGELRDRWSTLLNESRKV